MVMLLTFAVGIVVAHFTRFGANVYALGGNRTSAELMGVPVGTTTIRIYMLSSFLAALAGIVFSFYTSAGYSLAAAGVELDTIAAVVIGGTLLTGGYGTIIGTLRRRADPGLDPDLHHVRGNLEFLVDQDRHRRAAVRLHRAAAGPVGGVASNTVEFG